jgi:hypothetical protein
MERRVLFRHRTPSLGIERWALRTGYFALLAFLGLASVALSAEIGGRYRVAGTNLDGSKYGGTVDITISSDTDCHIVWHSEGPDLNGICMRGPETFVAAYVDQGAAGLVLYKIEADGTLNGVWTEDAHKGIGADVLTPERLTSSGGMAPSANPAPMNPVGPGGMEPSTNPPSNPVGPGGVEPSTSPVGHGSHSHHQAP